MVTPAPQDRWSQDKHIELVNIIGNSGAGILTRAMAKQLSVASAHECRFVDFISEEEPKKRSAANERGILINQEKYVKDLLKKYDINGSSVKTPIVPPNNLGPDLSGKSINETQYRGMIGSLMYLKGTHSHGLWYPKCSSFDLKGYSNFDYVGCNMDRKSISAISLAEAEYVAAARCCANILWMKSQLTDYEIIYEKVPIFCDNTSAIAISNNPILHSRTKHIDIRYHLIIDHVLKGDIELHFIPTQYQHVDIFTKPMDDPTFKILIVKLGMLNIDSKPEASALPEEN
ncbi:hypothetical protein Tco_0490797 [Tanacetum coccineum]